MIEVLFVQGGGADTHDDWDRALVDSLEHALGDGYRVHYPRMPDEANPRATTWQSAIRAAIDELAGGAILVGHSIGGTLLVHALADRGPRCRVGALVLVAAPFIGEGGWPSDDLAARAFDLAYPIILFQGAADTTVQPGHVQLYARAIPHATVHVLGGRDHQLNDDLSEVAAAIRSLAR